MFRMHNSHNNPGASKCIAGAVALNLRGVGDGVLDSGLCHDKTNMSGALPSDSVLLSPPRWYGGTRAQVAPMQQL